jgi:hypothetical protein
MAADVMRLLWERQRLLSELAEAHGGCCLDRHREPGSR